MPLAPPSYGRSPHVAFAWLDINGTPITTIDEPSGKPRHLESFSCTFMTETLGKFEFVLFDPDFDVVEEQVSKSKGKCTFRFGYTQGLQSPTYEGFILEYVPEFSFDGLRIYLRGLTLALNMQLKKHVRVWENYLISNIVTIIADENGMSADVKDTKKIEFTEDVNNTKFVHKTWQQNETDWQFIVGQLLPQAVTSDGKAGGYVLYYDAAENTLHFHPPKFDEGPVKTFIYRNPLSEILRFTPRYNGNLLAATLYGASTQAPSQDLTDSSRDANVKSDSKKIDEDTGTATDSSQNQTCTPDAEEDFSTGAAVTEVYYDKHMAGNAAKFWWYRHAYLSAFTGELEVVGDPTLKPWKKYDIQMQKPTGGLHWTSGLYWAQGITHAISGGLFRTTLNLMKSGRKTADKSSESVP